MKLGIVTIATGEKHNRLCKIMLDSVYKYFLPDLEKTFYVIGDDTSYLKNNENFKQIMGLPAPLTTLLRFYFLSMIIDKLETCDVIFYFDADLEVRQLISYDEIMPEREGQFVVTRHPWARGEDNRWTLEQNKTSTAYIENVPQYYQACFFGAYKSTFLEMVKQLNNNVNVDLFPHRIIARWFDESHFNKYVVNVDKKILSDNYCFPKSFQHWDINSEVKIAHYNAHNNA